MSKEKIYQELGLESLQFHRWYRKICLIYKAFKNVHPKYLFNFIPARSTSYATRLLLLLFLYLNLVKMCKIYIRLKH